VLHHHFSDLLDPTNLPQSGVQGNRMLYTTCTPSWPGRTTSAPTTLRTLGRGAAPTWHGLTRPAEPSTTSRRTSGTTRPSSSGRPGWRRTWRRRRAKPVVSCPSKVWGRREAIIEPLDDGSVGGRRFSGLQRHLEKNSVELPRKEPKT